MKAPQMPTLTKKRALYLAVGVGALAAVSATAAFASGFVADRQQDHVKAAVAKEFPNTTITSVDCRTGPAGLCEVIAGRNVFYVTKNVDFAIVGAVLDLENKVDRTDERIRQLAAVATTESRIAGGGVERQAPGAAAPAQAVPAPGNGAKIDLAQLAALSKDGAIIHNPGAPLKLTVFTDLNCGYCKQLHDQLKTVTDIEVTEYVMSYLGADSGEKAKLALCARDRVKGVDAIYTGGEVVTSGDCKAAEAAVAANTQFGHANGINGTPFLIRADGVTQSGWLPLDQLRTFLQGAK